MRLNNVVPMRWLAGACSAVMMLALAQAGVGQQTSAAPSTTPARPVATVEQEGSPKPSKPGSEGVKVHGHWVLQVKNADGTLGEKREFDNSLVNGSSQEGDFFLTGLLSGNLTIGDMSIGLISGASGTYSSNWCEGAYKTPPAGISCYGLIDNSGWASSWKSTYLVTQSSLTSVANFKTSNSVVLTANFVNQASYGLTSLSSVLTQAVVSGQVGNFFNADNEPFSQSSDSPGALSTGPVGQKNPNEYVLPFTETQIANGPLAISAGQTVTVVVTISFS
jgi:hypothetical protein